MDLLCVDFGQSVRRDGNACMSRLILGCTPVIGNGVLVASRVKLKCTCVMEKVYSGF